MKIMEKTQTKLIVLIVICVLIAGSILAYFLLKPDTKIICGDNVCSEQENWQNCIKDCEKPLKPFCGDKVCEKKEEGICLEDCPLKNSEESHFGTHVGRLNLKDEISELGNIYSRINLGPDAYGWKIAKSNSIASCRACCIEPGCASECVAGYIYYCEPANREGLPGKDMADEFYADDYEILFSVSPGSYGTEPKSIQDFLSLDYPADASAYKEYIKYLLQQYPNVEYWEVGNEANNPQFWGDTAANYVRLVTLTSNEIKNRCLECRVGISLVGPNPPDEWFNAITGICDTIDFLDLHQYHSETMDELKEFEDNDLTKWKNSCPGVEIISTETGIPSEHITFKDSAWELGTSETKQAQDLIKYLTMMFNAGYSKIYYYLFDSDFVPGMEDIFEHTGLLNEDNSRKEAFKTYQLMIQKVDYFTSINKLAEGQYKYSFENKDPVYVLWCNSGSCSISSEISGTVRVTNYQGNTETINASEIRLDYSPIFVEKI